MNENEESEIEKFVRAAVERGYSVIMSIEPVVTAEGLERSIMALEDACGRVIPSDMGIRE